MTAPRRQPKSKPTAAPKVAVYLRVDQDLRDALYAVADERGVTASRLLVEVLEEWLSKQK